MHTIDMMRARSIPTVPSTFGLELKSNPFLHSDSPGLQK